MFRFVSKNLQKVPSSRMVPYYPVTRCLSQGYNLKPRPTKTVPVKPSNWNDKLKFEKILGSNVTPTTTLESKVSESKGLSRYIAKTYTKVALGSAATLGFLSVAPHYEFFFEHPLQFLLGGLLGGFLSIGVMAYNPPKIIIQDTYKDDEASTLQNVGFWGLVGSMSLSMAPFACMVHDVSPTILPASAVVSSLLMGGASLYAYRTNPDKFVYWKGPLVGGLLTLVGINLIGLTNALFFGSTSPIFALMNDVNVYGGIVLFTAYTSYDTYKLVTDYEKNELNHINHACHFYLNFVNLLTRVMNIMKGQTK